MGDVVCFALVFVLVGFFISATKEPRDWWTDMDKEKV